MGQITYKINNGYPNFTAHIEPNVAADQIHSSIGTYSFTDIPVGDYSITITDAIGCEAFIDNIHITPIVVCTNPILQFTSNTSEIYIDLIFKNITLNESKTIVGSTGDGNLFYATEPNEFGTSTLQMYHTYSQQGIYDICISAVLNNLSEVDTISIRGGNIISSNLDFSRFENLSRLEVIEWDALTTYNAVTSITLPLTNNIDGIYFALISLPILDNLSIPGWNGTKTRVMMAYLLGLQDIIVSPNLETSEFNIQYSSLLPSIDISNITMTEMDGYYSLLSLNNCDILNNINLPSQFTLTNSTTISIVLDENLTIGHTDLTPLISEIFSVDQSYQLTIRDNSYSSALVNQILTELDSYNITHTTPGCSINIGGNNGLPDNSSGGYDGLLAITNLENKNIQVII